MSPSFWTLELLWRLFGRRIGSSVPMVFIPVDLIGQLLPKLQEFNGELARGPRDPETAQRITQMLSSVRINPKEWEQYTHFVGGRYTR
eukprot:1269320-Amorphochlora_amoeboformis.AAC.2